MKQRIHIKFNAQASSMVHDILKSSRTISGPLIECQKSFPHLRNSHTHHVDVADGRELDVTNMGWPAVI